MNSWNVPIGVTFLDFHDAAKDGFCPWKALVNGLQKLEFKQDSVYTLDIANSYFDGPISPVFRGFWHTKGYHLVFRSVAAIEIELCSCRCMEMEPSQGEGQATRGRVKRQGGGSSDGYLLVT